MNNQNDPFVSMFLTLLLSLTFVSIPVGILLIVGVSTSAIIGTGILSFFLSLFVSLVIIANIRH